MTTWDERLDSHPAMNRIDAIRTTVSQQLNDDELGEAARPWLQRFKRVLDVVHGRLQAVDAELVSAAVLQSLDTSLQEVQTRLQNFLSSGDAQQLAQADPRVDSILQSSTPLMAAILWDEREVEDLREHVTNYRRSAGQLLASLSKEAEDLGKELGQIRASVAETSQAHGAKFEELSNSVKEERQTMEAALTDFRESFSTAQDERRTTLSDLLEEQTARFSEALKALDEEAENQRLEASDEASRLVNEMEGYRDQAAQLVDAVGNIGTAAGFGRYASEQKRAADWLRGLAVVVVLGAVGFAVWALSVAASDLTWQRTIAKFTVVALLGGLAAYLGRQSGVHRDREATAKRVQLELAALDPYLALMDAGKRDEVKIEIAKKLFGQPLEAENVLKSEEPMPASQVLALLVEFFRRTP